MMLCARVVGPPGTNAVVQRGLAEREGGQGAEGVGRVGPQGGR